MTKQKVLFHLVNDERVRQDNLWGVQDHDEPKWLSILLEEVGEVARAVNEKDVVSYRKELVQVAAVAVAMLESEGRNGWQQ